MIIRRVVGISMLPALKPGQLIIARRTYKPKPQKVIVALTKDREVIKRVKLLAGRKKAYLIGDNWHASSSYEIEIPRTKMWGVIWPIKL